MKKSAFSILAVVVLVSCSTSMSSSGPPVSVDVAQLNASSNIFYFAGPVALQYQVRVTNPTNDPVTLTRLDLETIGSGAYFLRSSGTPMNLTIPPNSTQAYTISVWGRARGGYLASSEPVTLRTVAYFHGPAAGSFVRMSTGNVIPVP